MPAYDAEKYIEESINSVMRQTYPYWELIVVDDGSVDNTATVIRSFGEADRRIKYFFQSNGKQGKARNTGIQKAVGELIAFLDADDIWKPEKLEEQLILLKNTDADLVFSDIVVINEKGSVIRESWGVKDAHYSGTEGLLQFFTANKIPLLTALVKKEAILAVKGFRESETIQYGEDYDLWLRMLQNNYVFKSTGKKLGAYREHTGQATQNKTAMLQVINTVKNIEVSGVTLKRQKKKAIALWIRRWLHSNRELNKAEMATVISMYPSRLKRAVLSFLYPISSNYFFRNLLDKFCAFDIRF